MGDKMVPKVGISLLAYNQGKYIEASLDALKKQTFQGFEVFLIDDASNDDYTTEKLKTIKYEKIAKKFFYEKNLGSARRRIAQYKVMKNDYILDLCADDVLAPDFLEKTVSFLDKHDDYGAVSTNILFFESEATDAYAEKKFDEHKMDLKHVLARNQILGSSLTRRKALGEADLSGGFRRYNDWDRWISIMEAGWKIGLVPEPLFYYRQVPTSLSHSASIEDEMEIRVKLLKKHADSYKKYYREVITNMEYAFLEMQEGKNWLDGQYKSLNKEIDRLSGIISDLQEEIKKRDEPGCSIRKKIKRALRI